MSGRALCTGGPDGGNGGVTSSVNDHFASGGASSRENIPRLASWKFSAEGVHEPSLERSEGIVDHIMSLGRHHEKVKSTMAVEVEETTVGPEEILGPLIETTSSARTTPSQPGSVHHIKSLRAAVWVPHSSVPGLWNGHV